MTYDIIITEGTCYRNGRFEETDLFIAEGKIAGFGRWQGEEAGRIISAKGRIVSPGFIDVHNHGDLQLLQSPDGINCLSQGVTTVIVGNCGVSAAPTISDDAILLNTAHKVVTSTKEYPTDLGRAPLPVNVGFLAGHGSIRGKTVGYDDRQSTVEEQAAMRSELAYFLDHGALGLSTGLAYAPGMFAAEEEVTGLASLVRHRGIYTTHMRNEDAHLLDAIKEQTAIARRSHVPLEISHLKAAGVKNWGTIDAALKLIEAHAQEGPIGFDVYPYTGGHTTLAAAIPRALLRNKVTEQDIRQFSRSSSDQEIIAASSLANVCQHAWEDIIITSCTNKDYTGRTIASIAREKKTNPQQALLTILGEDIRTKAIYDHMMDEGDVETLLRHPLAIIASDGFVFGETSPCHPRNYGTFTRILRYAREGKMELPDALDKITSTPSERFGIKGRGTLHEGLVADITLFDPETVADHATNTYPTRISTGIELVIINGRIAYDGNSIHHAGTVLRGGTA